MIRLPVIFPILLLVVIVLGGCGKDEFVTPTVVPENSRYVQFKVYRNSLRITDAAITDPTWEFTQDALLTVGLKGRGLIYSEEVIGTPIFVDTAADLLALHYTYEEAINICGAREDGTAVLRGYNHTDGWFAVPHTARGNLTDANNTYFCTDEGEILKLSTRSNTEPVFQAPDGVRFKAILRSSSPVAYVVAIGDDGAIFHQYEDGEFVDESIEGGPDFVKLTNAFSPFPALYTLYAVGGDEIWKYENGSWSQDYGMAPGNLNDIQVVYDHSLWVVGDNGLFLKKDEFGWWDDVIDPEVDFTAIAMSNYYDTNGDVALCGSKGEIFREYATGWRNLNRHAEGPWPAFHATSSLKVYSVNGNRLMLSSGDDWVEVSTWEMGHQLLDIHVVDDTHIWAVGVMADGLDFFILFFDGADWSIENHASFLGFTAIWCDATGDRVFATDATGTIWSPQEGIWEGEYFHSSEVALNDLYGTSLDDLVAVGDSGLILRRGAEDWAIETSGTTANLRAVGGQFAVGDSGTVLKHDGGGWSDAGPDWNGRFNAVWFGGANNIWVVGDEATVFQFDGTRWIRLLTHLPGIDFLSVDNSGLGKAWIGGTEGYLLRSP